MNITSPESSGDSESNMSDVRECQTKSEGKMEKFYKIDPYRAPFQVLLSKMNKNINLNALIGLSDLQTG